MYVGLYAGPFVQTSRFELPDLFGTKAQETTHKLLANLPVGQLNAQVQATATPVARAAVVAPVPAEAAESGIQIPFGIGTPSKPGAPPAAVAVALGQPAPAAPQTAAAPVPAAHAVGSRHRVANTNGDGVYLRRTPRADDRLRPWADNTVMIYEGETVQAEGMSWAKVKDPAGNVGWVPVQYLTPDNSPLPPAVAAAPPNPVAPIPAPAGVQTVPIQSSGITTQPPAPGPVSPSPKPPQAP